MSGEGGSSVLSVDAAAEECGATVCAYTHKTINNSSEVLKLNSGGANNGSRQSVESLDDNGRGAPAAVADGGAADGGVPGLEHAVQGA